MPCMGSAENGNEPVRQLRAPYRGSENWSCSSQHYILTKAQICRDSGDLKQTGSVVLILLFTSFFTIPLPRQRFLYASLFAGLQVEGMTFHFFNDVFLLDLALKPAQCIFKRLAFLNANLCQRNTPPNDPRWA